MANRIVWNRPIQTSGWTQTEVQKDSGAGYSIIATVTPITTTYFYDATGISTDLYKIRFYDTVNLYYSEFSSPITATAASAASLRTTLAITILGTLGAIGPDSLGNYSIYGMKINQTVADALVAQCYDYTTELVGETAIVATDSSTVRKVSGFISNYSALRILGVLNGVGITKHFNYTSGGLNIQKPFVGQMAAMMDFYKIETRRWQKLLLSRAIVTTGASRSPGSADLDFSLINEQAPEGSGIAIITYDAKNL